MIKAFMTKVKRLWQNSKFNELRDTEELERLGVLQQIASSRRAEYAEELGQSGSDAEMCRSTIEARRKMNEAETAHTLALREWENRESRQKSY